MNIYSLVKEFKKINWSSKRSVFVILVLILVINISIVSFVYLKKRQPPEEPAPEAPIPEEIKPSDPGTTGEMELKEGQTEEDMLGEVNPGAIENPIRPPQTVTPPVIFNTKGTIISVGGDSIMIEGNGSNFQDQVSRALTIKFTDDTVTFEKGSVTQYQGKEGLKYLSLGGQVLIESSENIRGKTQFTADYINKI